MSTKEERKRHINKVFTFAKIVDMKTNLHVFGKDCNINMDTY